MLICRPKYKDIKKNSWSKNRDLSGYVDILIGYDIRLSKLKYLKMCATSQVLIKNSKANLFKIRLVHYSVWSYMVPVEVSWFNRRLKIWVLVRERLYNSTLQASDHQFTYPFHPMRDILYLRTTWRARWLWKRYWVEIRNSYSYLISY